MDLNWEFLLSFILAFCVIFVIFMTLGFYINFKKSNKKSKVTKPINSFEGKYFKKFNPKEEALDHNFKKNNSSPKIENKWLAKVFFAFPIFLFFVISLVIFNYHNNLLFKDIKLSSDENSRAFYKEFGWDLSSNIDHEYNEDIFQNFNNSGKSKFIIWHEDTPTWKIGSTANAKTTDQVQKDWEVFFNEKSFNYTLCNINRHHECKSDTHDIHIIMPHSWDFSVLEKVTSKNNSIIIGPPKQIFEDHSKILEWNGIRFSHTEEGPFSTVNAVSDTELTLGWNPGTLIESSSHGSNYKVESANPSFIRTKDKSSFSHEYSTAAQTLVSKNIRAIWTDLRPRPSVLSSTSKSNLENFWFSMFRYLTNPTYEGISGWPGGSKMGLSISIEVDDNTDGLNEFLDHKFFDKDFITFNMNTTFANSHRGFSKKLAKKGEILCKVSPSQLFAEEEHLRSVIKLLLCKKTINTVTDQSVVGLRVDTEAITTNLLDVAKSSGFNFIYSGTTNLLGPFIVSNLNNDSHISIFPRTAKDDFTYFKTNTFNEMELKNSMIDEFEWTKRLGSLFTLSFHSRFMNESDFKSATTNIFNTLLRQKSDLYIGSVTDHIRWLHIRRDLSRGRPILEADLKKFNPYILRLTKNGKVIKSPYSIKRKVTSGESN